MMNTLDKIYTKFTDIEQQYLKSGMTRSDFINERFGGDIVIGTTILTDAILRDGLNSTEEINKFSSLKNLFAMLLKYKDNLDSLSSFDFDNNDIENMEDILQKLSATITKPFYTPAFSQKDLFEKKNALHYAVTPDTVYYVSPDSCQAYKILNENFAILLKVVKNNKADFKVGSIYIEGKRGLRKCKQSELLPYLTEVYGD